MKNNQNISPAWNTAADKEKFYKCRPCLDLGFIPGQLKKRDGAVYEIAYACPNCPLGTEKRASLNMIYPPEESGKED